MPAMLGSLGKRVTLTLSIVPGSVYLYAPNKGAAIFFTIAFAVSLALHLWQPQFVALPQPRAVTGVGSVESETNLTRLQPLQELEDYRPHSGC